jgi:phospholipid-binding lipoprotein MlaA
VALTPAAEADPWESTNRTIYGMNRRADRYVLQPAVKVYRTVMPEAARRGVTNAYNNLDEPLNLLNAVGQGKIKSGFRALDRILVNGLLGLGVADHATDMGLPEQPHDFGQTMAVWGVPSGPYLVMPFFGPSTARDGVGFLVDFFGDPINVAEGRLLSPTEGWFELGLTVVDARSKLAAQGEQLLAGSADEYATVRSAWLQIRRNELFDGNPPIIEDEDVEPYPDAVPAPPAAAPVAEEQP